VIHEQGDNPAAIALASIENRDIDNAVKLADYFKSHLLRVIHAMTGGLGSLDASRIASWIKRNRLTEFREADVGADLRKFRKDEEALAAALQCLVEAAVIRPKSEEHDPARRGPKPSPMYEVNPKFLGHDRRSSAIS
jgi:hypothetical protein